MIIYDYEQNSPEWFKAKHGILTSSRVSSAITSKIISKTEAVNYLMESVTDDLKKQLIEGNIDEKTFKKSVSEEKKALNNMSQSTLESKIPEEMYELAFARAQKKEYFRLLAEKLEYFDDIEEDPRDRGHRLEDEAISKVEKKFNVVAKIIGLCVREDYKDIGLSPDALISDDKLKRFVGGIEIKSPGVVNHLEIWKKQKIPSEYFEQVIQYFVVAEVDYVIFASYNPIVKECPLVTIVVKREEVESIIKKQFEDCVNIMNHVNKDVLNLTF